MEFMFIQEIASLKEMAIQAMAAGDKETASELYTRILKMRMRNKRRNQLNWWKR